MRRLNGKDIVHVAETKLKHVFCSYAMVSSFYTIGQDSPAQHVEFRKNGYCRLELGYSWKLQ